MEQSSNYNVIVSPFKSSCIIGTLGSREWTRLVGESFFSLSPDQIVAVKITRMYYQSTNLVNNVCMSGQVSASRPSAGTKWTSSTTTSNTPSSSPVTEK